MNALGVMMRGKMHGFITDKMRMLSLVYVVYEVGLHNAGFFLPDWFDTRIFYVFTEIPKVDYR